MSAIHDSTMEQRSAGARPARQPRRRLLILISVLVALTCAWIPIHRVRINDRLLTAVVAREPAAVRGALEAGADPNLRLPLMHDDSGPFNLVHWLKDLLQGKASSRPNNQRSMLMVAASLGDGPICADLVAHGADMRVRLSNGSTALLLASRARSADALRVLLDHGASLQERDSKKRSPYLIAVEEGGVETIRAVLDHGADVNEQDVDRRPALAVAVERKQPDVVRLLLDRGADLKPFQQMLTTSPPNSGYSPSVIRSGRPVRIRFAISGLDLAARNGSAELIRALGKSEAGRADIHARGRYVLTEAVQSGRIEAVKALLELGAGGDDIDALDLACQQGRADMADLLLSNGARVNNADSAGRTPLFCACTNGNGAALTKNLIARGADVKARTGQGETTLMAAVNSPELTKLMLLKGVDARARTIRGESAMSRAYRPEVIKLLAEAGADVNDVGDSGEPPLLRAASNREVALYLLSRGADPRLPNRQGETAISRTMDAAVIGALLKNGANPDERSLSGMTPLMSAVWRRDRDSVAALLEHHADPNVPDNQGRTPLSFARQMKIGEIAALLEKAGAKE